MHLATSFSNRRRASLQASRDGFLSEDDLRARVPSIFAEAPHASRSGRYTYIPTIAILRGLADEGFLPTFACQAIPRDGERHGFTKHMIRFRRASDRTALAGEAPEIIGINSHAGETSFQIIGGFFRFVCCNGMILGDGCEEIRVRHSGRIVDDVIEGTYLIADSFDEVSDKVSEMKAMRLAPREQLALAESAAILRLDTPDGERPAIAAEQFNRARRADDSAADLWTTFNRVQENTIRGGLHGVTRTADGRRRNMTTRPVEGIDQNVKLNRALWTLAERMAEIKRAN